MFLIRSAMTRTIDTLGRALRHQMVLCVECTRCHRKLYYQTASLATKYGMGKDPLRLQFECEECKPPRQKLTLLEPRYLDPDVAVLRLEGDGPNRRWVPQRIGTTKTLRDAWKGYETIIVYCAHYGCGHSMVIDFGKTAAVIGWDHPVMAHNLLPYFFCTKCREDGRDGKKLRMIVHVDHRPLHARLGPPDMWRQHPQSEMP
jgi:hypothetical protein